MKVLRGFFKGVEISVPDGGVVRPTVDHFKKHILRLAEEKKPRVVWDLFAGSGGVGIELLSQGATIALFVEQWNRALDFLRLNLGECQLKNGEKFALCATQILSTSVEGFLKNPHSYTLSQSPDLVFLDPPYGQGLMKKMVPLLLDCALIPSGTLILAEHVTEDPLGDFAGRGNLIIQENYGPKNLSGFVKIA